MDYEEKLEDKDMLIGINLFHSYNTENMTKYIQIIVFFVCFTLASGAFAQTPQQTFKVATEAFENGNYTEAVSKAKACITQLGSSNPRVQSLLVQCYYEQKDWLNAKTELNRYKKMATNATSEAHRNLLSLETEIDRQIEILENNHKKEVDKKRLAEAEKIIATNQEKNTQKQTQIENDYNTAVGKIRGNITQVDINQEETNELLEQGDSTTYYMILKSNKKKYLLKSVSEYNIKNKEQVFYQGIRYFDEKGRRVKFVFIHFPSSGINLQDTLSTSALETAQGVVITTSKFEDLGNDQVLEVSDGDRGEVVKKYRKYDDRGNVIKDSTIIFRNGTWMSSIVSIRKYDSENRLVENNYIEDGKLSKSTYTFPNKNIMKSQNYTWLLDELGNSVRTTENNNGDYFTTSEYQYDHRGNIIVEIQDKHNPKKTVKKYYTNEYWDGTVTKGTFPNATQEKETSVTTTEVKKEETPTANTATPKNEILYSYPFKDKKLEYTVPNPETIKVENGFTTGFKNTKSGMYSPFWLHLSDKGKVSQNVYVHLVFSANFPSSISEIQLNFGNINLSYSKNKFSYKNSNGISKEYTYTGENAQLSLKYDNGKLILVKGWVVPEDIVLGEIPFDQFLGEGYKLMFNLSSKTEMTIWNSLSFVTWK